MKGIDDKPIPSRLKSYVAVTCLFLVPLATVAQTVPPAPAPQLQHVKMSLIVADKHNMQINNLRQEDIHVTEEGRPLKISLLGKDLRPLVYTIVVDTSGSFHTELGRILELVKAFIENNRPEDETSIVRFVSSDKINTMTDFTADKSKLIESLKLMRIEGGQTAVLDAVYLTVGATAKHRADDAGVRRAVLLFSDGEDRNSFYSLDHVTKLLRETDVQIFVLGMVSRLDKEGGLIRRSPRERAESLLQSLARESGGRVFFPRNVEELVSAAQQINQSLSSQYIITLEREVKPGEKGFRKVKITLSKDAGSKQLMAITRPGYLVGPKETDNKR